jgi:deazaflavin-dependent oxidoreductase (nitroreductase family)
MIGTPKIKDVAEPASDYNTKIIEEFRANGGKVGGRYANANLLLLHHTGAKSGAERVNPVAYHRVGEGFAVFASKAGAPVNPDWYHNLVAHPDTMVEVGTETVWVRARVPGPAERDEIWARQIQLAPHFADYQRSAAPRRIPVVVLDPVQLHLPGQRCAPSPRL